MPRPSRYRWIIVALFLTIVAIAGSLVLLAIGLSTTIDGFLIGLMMAVVPVPLYVAFATWVDRFEPEPPWLLATAFLWGASIAVLFAMIFNGIGEAVLTEVAGAASASMLTAVLAAPFFEELAKGGALLLLFFWRRDEFDNVTDGIIYASMVGLGFAMTENVEYYSAAAGAQGGSEAGLVFFLRGVMGPFAHPLFTSMTGIGLGVARESHRKSVKFLAPLLGLAGAMLLHAVWNLSTNFGLVFFASYFFVMVPAFFAVIVVAIYSLRREARIVRSHLESVVADRVLSADDVIIVTSVRRRIGASTSALFQAGFGKWIARRRFHALATELAFHSWRASRYPDPDEAAIRAELVAGVREVRARLGLPVHIEPPDAQLVARLTRETPQPPMPAPAT
jgi:protease PrsW